MPTQLPPWLDHALALARVDFAPAHRQPSAARVLVALAVSVAGSLAADAILVVITTTLFPSTKGYVHFRIATRSTEGEVGVRHDIQQPVDREAALQLSPQIASGRSPRRGY